MLLPALQKARMVAVSAACQNNLKSYGGANQFYADDNRDYIPFGIDKGDSTYEGYCTKQSPGYPYRVVGYLGGAAKNYYSFVGERPKGMLCPVKGADYNGKTSQFYGPTALIAKLGPISTYYASGKYIMTGKFVHCRHPSKKFFLVDASSFNIYPDKGLDPSNPNKVSYRHNDGANALRFDGGVGRYSRSQFIKWIADGERYVFNPYSKVGDF